MVRAYFRIHKMINCVFYFQLSFKYYFKRLSKIFLINSDKLPDIPYRPWSKTTQAASTLDFEEIKQFLGITNEVDDCNFLDDPFCRNYFEYESGISDPLVKGRLKSALKFWRDELCAPKEVLDIIQDGYVIKFV